MTVNVCDATTRTTMGPADKDQPDIACVRPLNENGRHTGAHQGFHDLPHLGYVRLVTWDPSGSTSTRYDTDQPFTECALCGVLHNNTTGNPDTCTLCNFWTSHATTYATERETALTDWTTILAGGTTRQRRRIVVPHPKNTDQPFTELTDTLTMYSWAPGSKGAFGGRRYSVTFDDGISTEPADSLWFGGTIPWWFADQFPPNATITSHGYC